jgi:hypothetical protein
VLYINVAVVRRCGGKPVIEPPRGEPYWKD